MSSGPRLVFLIGPSAVGKMTVGLELERRTGMRLLHNHMTIDLVTPFFEFGTAPFFRLVESFRCQLVEEVAGSDLPGMVFSYVWAFDEDGEGDGVEVYAKPFRDRGLRVSFVEVSATQEERLRRNRTELRLDRKRFKRDLVWSDANLRELDERHVLESPEHFRQREDWLLIDTTNLSAAETADVIIEALGLPSA